MFDCDVCTYKGTDKCKSVQYIKHGCLYKLLKRKGDLFAHELQRVAKSRRNINEAKIHKRMQKMLEKSNVVLNTGQESANPYDVHTLRDIRAERAMRSYKSWHNLMVEEQD